MSTTKDVFEMDSVEFTRELRERTTADMVYKFAPEIYAYLSGLFRQNCMDSTLREWAFVWAVRELGIPYDQIYDRWLS